MMLLDLGQVATYFNVHKSTIYRWIKANAFAEPVLVGPHKRKRWPPKVLEAWAKQHNLETVGNTAGNGDKK